MLFGHSVSPGHLCPPGSVRRWGVSVAGMRSLSRQWPDPHCGAMARSRCLQVQLGPVFEQYISGGLVRCGLWRPKRRWKCRLGYASGLLPSTRDGYRRLPHWSSRLTRRTVKSSVSGEIDAVSEMADRVGLVLGCRGLCCPRAPPLNWVEDCESSSSCLSNKRPAAEKYPGRHFLATHGMINSRISRNVFRI